MNIARRGFPVLMAALLAACAGKPAPPPWQTDAQGALQGFTTAYLTGRTRAAELDFARARSALAATGRANLVAQAELIRCAVRAASLEFDTCTGFQALAEDAGPAEHHYAAYIAGRWEGLDPALLPAHHRALLRSTAQDGGKSRLAAIEDPLARLVAAGALLQNGGLTPADLELAAETAAGQGWRRPLLAWLGVQAERARQAGDQQAHERIQRRIKLATPPPR